MVQAWLAQGPATDTRSHPQALHEICSNFLAVVARPGAVLLGLGIACDSSAPQWRSFANEPAMGCAGSKGAHLRGSCFCWACKA